MKKTFLIIGSLILTMVNISKADVTYSTINFPKITVGSKLISAFDTINFIDEDEQFLLAKGDAFIGIKAIDIKNEWFFISSPFITFSYDRRWDEPPSSWEYENNKFKNLGKDIIQFAGRNIEIYVIQHMSNKKNNGLVFYSEELGVVAFINEEHLDLPIKQVYWLNTETGIAQLGKSG